MKTGKYNIMYVDDSEANCLAFKELVGEKHTVHSSSSLEGAFRAIGSVDVKLMVVDQRAVAEASQVVLESMKQKWQNLVLILLVELDLDEALRDAINQLNIYPFVVNPVDKTNMKLILNQALESIRLKDTLKRKSIELRLTEKKLSKIINYAMDAIITMNSRGEIIMANLATETMFGRNQKQLLQSNIGELFGAENRAKYQRLFKMFVNSKTTSIRIGDTQIVMAVDAQSHEFPIEGTLSKVIIDGDVFVNTILRNIEARVSMETDLRKSESEFRTLTESAPAAIFKLSRELDVQFLNKPEFLGIDKHKILDADFLNLIEDDKDRFQSLIEHVFDTAQQMQFELALKNAKNETRWYSIIASAIKREDQVESVMLLCNDTTKLYRSEKVLRALSDVQNAFIGNQIITDSFERVLKILLRFTSSDVGFIVEVEDAQNEFKAYATKTQYGFISNADFNSGDLEYAQRLIREVVKSNKIGLLDKSALHAISQLNCAIGVPFYDGEKLIGVIGLAKVKGEFDKSNLKTLEPILVTCSTVIKSYHNSQKKERAERETFKIKEEFTRNLESMVDERTKELNFARSELAQSLAKEKELNALKSRFVATASHEFRTPLSVIQSSMAVLALQVENMPQDFKSKFDKSFVRIKDHISRMTMLMDDVLIVGKLTSGSVALNKESINLVELCTEIISSHNEIQEDGRAVDFEINGEAYPLFLDKKSMEHAISNLVSNALKYSPGSAKNPMVSLNFNKNETIVRVIDFGIGIPADDLQHLFDPFYRASNAIDFKGTGLGSSIAKEYVELNGGKLSIISKVNEGSEFIIKLNNKSSVKES